MPKKQETALALARRQRGYRTPAERRKGSPASRVHVFPVTEDHVTDGGTCWCFPENDGLLVVHRRAQ